MILIVASKFDKSEVEVVEKLLKGATGYLQKAEVPYEVVRVPGAVEIPIAIKRYVTTFPQKYKAAIALGCILKGETDHYTWVMQSCLQGLTRLSLELNLPVIHGVLACQTKSQAAARAHLGVEYAQTALEMINLPDVHAA